MVETYFNLLAPILSNLLKIGALAQSLGTVENLPSTDGSSPEAHVVGIFELGEVCLEAMSVEIIHLFTAAQGHVAGQGNDFDAGGHDHESHVEAHLVVAGSGRAMGYGIRFHFLGISSHSHSLENSLRRNRNRIGPVTKNVSEDHVPQTFGIIFFRNIEYRKLRGAEFIGVFFIGFQLSLAETARIRAYGMDFIAFLLCKVHYREGGVKTAAKGDNYLFTHNNSYLSIFIH